MGEKDVLLSKAMLPFFSKYNIFKNIDVNKVKNNKTSISLERDSRWPRPRYYIWKNEIVDVKITIPKTNIIDSKLIDLYKEEINQLEKQILSKSDDGILLLLKELFNVPKDLKIENGVVITKNIHFTKEVFNKKITKMPTNEFETFKIQHFSNIFLKKFKIEDIGYKGSVYNNNATGEMTIKIS